LISVPIMVSGSRLVLRVIERFPALLYAGGAVLAWTSAKMIVEEPLVEHALAGQPLVRLAVYIALIAGVLGIAALRNRRSAKEVLP
jgi:predicted tellurium resistance membrane protein TerC